MIIITHRMVNTSSFVQYKKYTIFFGPAVLLLLSIVVSLTCTAGTLVGG